MQYQCVRTVCPYCAVGCNMFLEVQDGEVVNTLPVKKTMDAKSSLCIKGWSVHEFIQHPDRLRTPLIRRNKDLVQAGWEEALDTSAQALQQLRRTYGPESVAFVGSARCTNEEAYLFQKMARSLFGHNHVDHCARL